MPGFSTVKFLFLPLYLVNVWWGGTLRLYMVPHPLPLLLLVCLHVSCWNGFSLWWPPNRGVPPSPFFLQLLAGILLGGRAFHSCIIQSLMSVWTPGFLFYLMDYYLLLTLVILMFKLSHICRLEAPLI